MVGSVAAIRKPQATVRLSDSGRIQALGARSLSSGSGSSSQTGGAIFAMSGWHPARAFHTWDSGTIWFGRRRHPCEHAGKHDGNAQHKPQTTRRERQ